MDPLSVASLALAGFDELLRLGQRTVELISDIRNFDDDVSDLSEKVRHQTWKTAKLKQFLFDPSSIYGGTTLIEKLDEDAQDQIAVALGDLVGTLERAVTILKRFRAHPDPTLQTVQPNDVQNKSFNIEPSFKSTAQGQIEPTCAKLRPKPSKSPIKIIRWTMRDKKHACSIVQKFSELNTRLLEKIQFLTMASSIGVELQPLRHWEEDPTCIELGFGGDVALKIANTDEHTEVPNHELDLSWSAVLQRPQHSESQFEAIEWDGKHFLLETCVYTSVADHVIDPHVKARVNRLAGLLHQPKERLFGILPCYGWTFLTYQRRIGYLFEIPSELCPAPVSLLSLLGHTQSRPSLGTKLKLAYSLSRSIAQLHMVRWVHESFRSENILFFPAASDSAEQSIRAISADVQRPYIFGFEFSRPESYFSAGFIDTCTARDVYRHPVRQGQPLTTFKKIHDLYALGVVLLEIGIWRSAITLERNHFAHAKEPMAITNHLIKHARKHVEVQMGEKYRDIVLKCLTGDFNVVDDNAEDQKLQQAFRSQVVDVLERFVDAV